MLATVAMNVRFVEDRPAAKGRELWPSLNGPNVSVASIMSVVDAAYDLW